ncbi:MAG: ketohydroxyglutarate aldolase [Olsenella sp.]|jgi:2-dehydro-3-deoxyphosphogluconate aldolase/(4S)-4-hydroxy-2-oxoglutarate aldolase|nr:ketohydroxyglutarate aldolase [Olsenella sp.]MCI1666715.1 ketohydroxyglutarate aldolase [Olsenella sp.]MCI1794344.1 ketohydroxyglutarate aldolase [Olsenella sp.]MCI1811600.1 ketohydroxyglutarate aldolase [Olsenella sp.]
MKMQKAEVTERLAEVGAFAVVRVETVERGLEIADGLLRGGVPAMEISYTLPNAGEVISGIQDRFGDEMLVGAGTVMEAATARLAIMAGSEFVVSNMESEEVARVCNLYQVPYAPGCTTVTEAVKGLEMGAAFIKCFPISNTYGVQLVKLFKTPTPWMPLMASGGINLENLSEWVRAGVDTCGMGSLLTKGSAGEIAANAAEVRRIVDETRAEMGA